MNTQPWSLHSGKLKLFCHLQPAAHRDHICGLHNQRLKIQLKAAAVDGKANQALLKFLAKWLQIPRTDITIKSGISSRQKTLLINNIDTIPPQLSHLRAV